MSNGSLKEYLLQCKPTADGVAELLPYELSRLCADVASGMHFLSSQNFVHRDLAARLVHIPNQHCFYGVIRYQPRFFIFKVTLKGALIICTDRCLFFRNCLVNEHGTVKVSDFGLARNMNYTGETLHIFCVQFELWNYKEEEASFFIPSSMPRNVEYYRKSGQALLPVRFLIYQCLLVDSTALLMSA
jgi:serine/threonine protein kinase